MRKIVQQELITKQTNQRLIKPHLGLILLLAFLFGMPTISWAMQMNAALNKHANKIVILENYTETGEMF